MALRPRRLTQTAFTLCLFETACSSSSPLNGVCRSTCGRAGLLSHTGAAGAAAPTAEQVLRAHERLHHDQSQLRRIGERRRRNKDDHSPPRWAHPSIPLRRDRKARSLSVSQQPTRFSSSRCQPMLASSGDALLPKGLSHRPRELCLCPHAPKQAHSGDRPTRSLNSKP